MHYLLSYPLIRCIQKLKYQFFNHKSLGWIVLLISVMSIILFGIFNIISWIRNVCYCPLTYIVVTGKRHYTTNNDIHNVIKKLSTLGIFIIQDINIIQKKIELLPWIQQVSIRMQWPYTLKLHVIEHIPVAFWNDSQIISATGIIFDIPKICQNDSTCLMPFLYGPKDSYQDILINYYICNEILKKSIKLHIKSLKVDMRYSWELVLKNNICIKLGRKNIIERLNYFVKIYPVLLYKSNESNKYIDYVDLRYTTGFAVKWMSNVIASVLCEK